MSCNPSAAAKYQYIVKYRWLNGDGEVVELRCDTPAEAIACLRQHIDDNVNLEWSIRKEIAQWL